MSVYACNKEDLQEAPINTSIFSSSDTIVTPGNFITFESTAKGALLNDTTTHYFWHFEGGSPEYSTLKNGITVTYLNEGTFDVSVLVINGNSIDSITKKNYITVKGPTKEGLILYYPFNGNLKNLASQLNNGYADNFFVEYTTDKFNNQQSAYKAYWNRISCGDNPIGTDGSFTLSTNIYPLTNTYTSSKYEPNLSEYIISAGAQSGSTGYYLLWNNGKLRFGRKISNMSCDTIFGDFSTKKWYSIVSSYDSATHIVKIYVNKNKLIETSLINKGEKWVNNFNTFTIGAPNTPYNYYFNGTIDEIRLYKRSLSEDEIKYLW